MNKIHPYISSYLQQHKFDITVSFRDFIYEEILPSIGIENKMIIRYNELIYII
jgi:hypothetical protein